ncbi:two-component system response regulator [Lysinibacillus sp. KCTC 33748]|uniref:response regulator transcription factor n=1 Tax=unclassified Lysinibacillus TaxID=2636778 RepID=UPI0009A5D6E9|nr:MULTISPECIES: response regulator transcription factor [unclassified Lysinibacillus]OXS74807.1 two-component system response regulator [Lysinibacillus sp. KCTC 33748]SKB57766.1 DNA-binding response regulator, OmpR family, contains REC and winged-helix (wHTH) domain [Lysinibacillus sp. AC-3]
MKGFTILIVEDDPMIGDLMQKILQREGYDVVWKTDGREMMNMVHQIDLVIMDIMLPGEDGYQLTKNIKSLGLNIPIIFLSARNDIESKLQGLTVGEDYMTKPFDPRELLLRMQKMLEQQYGTFTQIQHLLIDSEHRKLFKNNIHDEIALTAIERKIFFYLYENKDRVLTKDHFFDYLWPLEDRNQNIINVHIKKIRTKMNDTSGTILQNIYGEGYRLNTYIKK